MKVDPCAPFSLRVLEMIEQTAPCDYPVGDLLAAHERGELAFLTVSDDDGIKAVVAYSIGQVGERTELRITGLNARGAPFLIRQAFAVLENMLAGGGRIVADIETDAMARTVEHLGMRLRALTYVKDVG